jgi:hypothetical protein
MHLKLSNDLDAAVKPLMLGGLLRCRYGTDLDATGNHLLIDLHGVDDDLVSNFDIRLLDRTVVWYATLNW